MKFTIIGKDLCSFCRSAKSFCDRKGYEYDYYKIVDQEEYDSLDDKVTEHGETVITKEKAIEMVGGEFRTVPQIVKHNDDGSIEYVGGSDELKAKFR